MPSYTQNGIAKAPSSKRASVVGERALEWLKAGTCAPQSELAKVVADDLGENFLYVQKAISEWFRSAGGEWTHVHPQQERDAHGHMVVTLRYDGTIARLPECRGTTRWRFDYTAQVVIQHLRANRGVTFTTPELAPAIGYPGTPGGLQTALFKRRHLLTKRGVVIAPGNGRSYTTYTVPAPKEVQAPVNGQDAAPSPFTAVAAVEYDSSTDTLVPMPDTSVEAMAERFAAGHAEAIKSVERDGWLEPVGRASNGDALYRTADGVIGRFQPL